MAGNRSLESLSSERLPRHFVYYRHGVLKSQEKPHPGRKLFIVPAVLWIEYLFKLLGVYHCLVISPAGSALCRFLKPAPCGPVKLLIGAFIRSQ